MTARIRLDGGPLHRRELEVAEDPPPATLHLQDAHGKPVLYLRTWMRYAAHDNTWRYLPSNPNHHWSRL